MDPENFLDLANQVTKLKMYPYFDLAHAIVCLVAIREDMGSGKSQDVMSNKLQHYQICFRRSSLFPEASVILLVLFNGCHLCWQLDGQFADG